MTCNSIEPRDPEIGKEIPKERYTSPEKRHQIIDDLILI